LESDGHRHSHAKVLEFRVQEKAAGTGRHNRRAGLHVPATKLKDIMGFKHDRDYGSYCETFLQEQFGATAVDSFDTSKYEGASHIADMNRPILIDSTYDTILDGGCLEHIYNVP